MKFRFRILSIFAAVLLVVAIGTIDTFAQVVPVGSTQPPVPVGTKCPTTNPNCKTIQSSTQNSGFNLNIKLANPLCSKSTGKCTSTIQDAIKLFVNAIVRLAIPVIVIFFLWSGLMFIFARGNPEKIKVAKNMFFYTIIGTLLILGAWTITNALVGTVNSLTS